MTHHKKARLGWWALAAGVLAAGACGFSQRGVAQEKIGKVQQGLVGGREVDEKAQENYGLLRLDLGGPECSASLLRNGWAISAAHCVEVTDAKLQPTPDPNRPGQNMLRPLGAMQVKAAWDGGQTQKIVRIETFRPYDVALIELAAPFKVHGKYWSFAREVFVDQFPYFGTPVNVPITVFGCGISQFAMGAGDSAVPSSSDGKYRMGKARVSREEGTLYWWSAPGSDHMVAGGDSGGPSFATAGTNQNLVLVGVHALTIPDYIPGKPQNSWKWVRSTPEAADAPIKPVWPQIEAIMGPAPKKPDSLRAIARASGMNGAVSVRDFSRRSGLTAPFTLAQAMVVMQRK